MTLRELEPLKYETPLRPAREHGERGLLLWLAPAKLVIDPHYQRDVGLPGKKNIKQIVEHFEWSMFSPLIVSPRDDGRYAVIDGQHRAIAAVTHGAIDDLPCYVIAADQAKQAKAFAVINGQVTAVNPLVLFRARVAGGDRAALAIAEAAKAAGVTIMPKPLSSHQLKPGDTQSPSAIGDALSWYGREVTVAALRCVTQSGNVPGMLRAAVISAFAEVMWRAPKWRGAAKLHNALATEGLTQIYTRALQRQAERGGALRGHLVEVITTALTIRLGVVQQQPLPPAPGVVARRAELKERGMSEHIQEQMRIGRGLGTVVAAKKAAAVKADPRALIAEHLKTHGVRKFESGATGDSGHLIDWLNRVAGVHAGRVSASQRGSKGGKIYQVGRKRLDLYGLIAVVNEERRKRNLEPITAGKAA